MKLDRAQSLIESSFATGTQIIDRETLEAIDLVLEKLSQGTVRVASRNPNGKWIVHDWVKKAILLYFRAHKSQPSSAGPLSFFDKVPIQTWNEDRGVRVVPPATVRQGAFVAPGAILMPSYVNIGAYVGEGSMVDTWATVGSCAQIGKNVHLSGGVGIGGVLEPPQAQPVIIEDHCFLGSRAIVVEGVHLEEGVVLGAGVILTSSTKIVDVSGAKPKTLRGRIPRNSVVIPGMQAKTFPAGKFGVPCALIIGKRTESTDRKTSLNQALRDFGVSA